MTRPSRLLVAALFLSALPSGAEKPREPNVLLVTIDTLRPDALGWVAGRNATPAIDALAKESFRFPGAVSEVPLTLPSHTSLLSGRLPRRHGVRDNGQNVPQDLPTLARVLRAKGYSTAAFVSGYPLRAPFGLDGGFDRYDDTLPVGAEGWLERPAPATTAAALAWVKTAKEPWFLWVHYYDPHDPYTPPKAFLRPGPRGAYDGEVAFTDASVGQLLAGLPRTGRDRITVLTADHGEGLGEHGETGHGFFVYDSTTLVPLLFHAPGRIAKGQSAAAVRLIDVTPTLLDLLGAPALAGADGVSVRPLLSGKEQNIPAAYVESRQPWITYGWAPLSAVRHDGWKLISAPRPELYHLKADPAEARNVVGQNRPKVMSLLQELERVEKLPASASKVEADPETLAKLRSLGYVGAGRRDSDAPRGLADPKDRIAERDRLQEGEDLLRKGSFDQAVRTFESVLVKDPANRFATLRAGIALLKKGDLAGARPRLEKAVALDPEQAENQYALADALSRLGLVKEAIPRWMETVRLQPRRVAAWSNLGSLLARDGRLPEARTAFARAVELEPRNPGLISNLAFLERAAGNRKAALDGLLRAATLQGAAFPYAGSVGVLTLSEKGPAEAKPWLARARPGETDFAEARFQLASIELYAGKRAEAAAALREAVAADPALRARAAQNPALVSLLPAGGPSR